MVAGSMSKSNQLLLLAIERGNKVAANGDFTGPNGIDSSRIGLRGYLQIWVKSRDLGDGNVLVHRIQAYQLYGDLVFAPGIEVRHRDGNKLNNSKENILLGSSSDNKMDCPKNERLRHAKVAASFLRKLTQYEAESLRYDRSSGATYADLIAKYGISKSTVSYVVNRKTYAG
jgi:HNH endonuclease